LKFPLYVSEQFAPTRFKASQFTRNGKLTDSSQPRLAELNKGVARKGGS